MILHILLTAVRALAGSLTPTFIPIPMYGNEMHCEEELILASLPIL